MHPALIRYATPPPPRVARYFLIGVAAGLAGLYAGHAVVEAIDATQASWVAYSRPRTLVLTPEREARAVVARVTPRPSAPRPVEDDRFDRWQARAVVESYALEALPAWVATHPDEPCPTDLFTLGRNIMYAQPLDPWGAEYQLACAHGIARVSSMGPDRVAGTADDIRSDR